MANWFITAAGSADRCGGECKHLYVVDMEPIILRTVRLIHKVDPDAKVGIISWRDELKHIPRTEYIDTRRATPSLAYTMYFTSGYLGNRNIILIGDTTFTQELIEQIYKCTDDFMVFGRIKSKISNTPERYALTFSGKMNYEVMHGLERCIFHPLRNEVPCCMTKGLAWKLGYLYTYRSGIIGWIFWHLCKPIIWYIARSTPMVEVTDPRVMDVDTPEELEEVRKIWDSVH